MPINFIPNDVLAQDSLPARQKTARRNRPAGRAGFIFVNASRQRLYEPGTPEFLFWQCREAALMAIETWETLNGKLTQWSEGVSNRKKLELLQNAGLDLNAYYDRQSISFFEFTTGRKTTFTGASTDVVAHEAGHACLDFLRPDIWDISYPEVNAFHEAFGDCMAVLTALSDKDTRVALLKASPDMGKANFVEALMEDMADGIKREYGASFDAAAPRHMLNNFKWQLPTTLPTEGRPSLLTSEEHSFGRVFGGCFYDTIRNIFDSLPGKKEAALWTAAQTAGKLLIEGTKKAPEKARFFQAVGQAMSLADQSLNRGKNFEAIKAAFDRHGISLGAAAAISARAGLAGGAPRSAATRGGMLDSATSRDLKDRIGAAPGDRLHVAPLEMGGERMVKAVHNREVPLTGLSERLRGVVAFAPESVLVGTVGRRSAIMSALPEPTTTTDEVRHYVESLLAHDRIAFEPEPRTTRGATRGATRGTAQPAPITRSKPDHLPTHAVRTRGNKKMLVRLRFGNCR